MNNFLPGISGKDLTKNKATKITVLQYGSRKKQLSCTSYVSLMHSLIFLFLDISTQIY